MHETNTSRRGFLAGAGLTVAAMGTATMGGLVGGLPTAGAASTTSARRASDHGAEVIHTWTLALYDAVLASGLTPPDAARHYAYCAIAAHEAVVDGMPGPSLAGRLNGLSRRRGVQAHGHIDWPSAASVAVHTVAASLFAARGPEVLAGLDATLSTVGKRRRNATDGASVRNGEAHGRRIGEHLLAWIAQDGHAATVDRAYSPPIGPGMWRSTPPNFGTAIEPHWAEVRPLVLRRADEITPAAPIAFSDQVGSAFHDQALVVYDTSKNLTDEHVAIARFWTDNPRLSGLPSGHWHLIADHLLTMRGSRLDEAVAVHAWLGIALHDAFTNCWTWKYHHNLIRPVSYIRDHIDPAWTTVVNTPQFPEFTSGHSVASAAAATVLTAHFGTVAFVDDSHAPRSLPARSFASIWAAAEEAASSRLYGGIHFPMGIEHGLTQGRAIGDLIVARLRIS